MTTLLIVDDNRDAAESLGMLLQMDGHTVTVVHDGRQALASIEASRPDVALLDIGMPGVDGYEMCRRIRLQPSGRHVVVIALTVLLASREIPASDEHVWRDGLEWASQRKAAAPYLTFLRDQLGYTLSPIEAAVAAGEQFDPLAADAEAAGQDGLTTHGPDDQDEGGEDAEADNSADAAGRQADEAADEDEAPASTEVG